MNAPIDSSLVDPVIATSRPGPYAFLSVGLLALLLMACGSDDGGSHTSSRTITDQKEQAALTSTGPSESAVCPTWNTPEYFASATSQEVQRCIDAEYDPNEKNQIGFTPLHFASEAANVAAIDVLIDAGSDANAQAEGGQTPLHIAASIARTQS